MERPPAGQIVVTQDLLGLTDWQPAFAQPISDLGNQLVETAMEWRRKVSAGDLGEHPYRMKDGSTPRQTSGNSRGSLLDRSNRSTRRPTRFLHESSRPRGHSARML